MKILDLSHERSSKRLDYWVNHSYSWTRDDIDPESCIVKVSDEVEVEFLQMAESIEANPLPTVLRTLSQFDIPKTRGFMREIRERLDEPPGVAVIDRMPLEKISVSQATDIFLDDRPGHRPTSRTEVGWNNDLPRARYRCAIYLWRARFIYQS